MAGRAVAGGLTRIASLILIPISLILLAGSLIQAVFLDEVALRAIALISSDTGAGYSHIEVRAPVNMTFKPPPGVEVISVIDPFNGWEVSPGPGGSVWIPGGLVYIKVRAPADQVSFVVEMEPSPRARDLAFQVLAGAVAGVLSLVLWVIGGSLVAGVYRGGSRG